MSPPRLSLRRAAPIDQRLTRRLVLVRLLFLTPRRLVERSLTSARCRAGRADVLDAFTSDRVREARPAVWLAAAEVAGLSRHLLGGIMGA